MKTALRWKVLDVYLRPKLMSNGYIIVSQAGDTSYVRTRDGEWHQVEATAYRFPSWDQAVMTMEFLIKDEGIDVKNILIRSAY